MKNRPKNPRSTLSFLGKLGTAGLAAILLFAVPVVGFAQEITGSVRGTVRSPTGSPVTGSVITVTDTRTGAARTVTASDSGSYNIRGLTVGGPYTIAVSSGEYKDALVTDVFTTLSGAATFNITLEDAAGAIEEIVVTASRDFRGADIAIGPNTSFSLADIEAMPTISRQIRDVVRLDPRVGIGRSNSGQGFGISCSGSSGRSNSFTIDGVRSADGFGLNSSGNNARNTFPIPFDSVGSASVEFAPIDVQYGNFTGCNVNVVTKSGTNEFIGSAFYLFNDESMTGDSLAGNSFVTEPFEDTNWGAELGGPIIRDKLFFYASYEETDAAGVQARGPIGGGFPNEGGPTVAETEAFSAILINQYGRDPGPIVRTLPRTSERVFARLDWNINDAHRMEATYLTLEESNMEPDDFNFVGFTFEDNFEIEGTDADSYSVRLFSNWTDRFSTEIRYSSLDVQDLQGPVGGGEAQDDNKPRLQVYDSDVATGNSLMLSGPGQFRSANDLQYTLDQFKLSGDFVAGDHTITAGYELDSLDVFNLFVVNATGTIEFDNLAAFAAGTASEIGGGGSFTGDINDAGATFQRDIHTFYLQDEWQVNDRLILTAGLRFDTYSSSDAPIENPVWEQRYGFTNTTAFDGLDIVLPRIGLTYDMAWNKLGEMQVRAGFGTFTGGDPTVHFSNTFSNFGGGVGNGNAPGGTCVAADLQVLNPGFTGIPQCITDQQIVQANLNRGRADAVDPSFDLPSQDRFNIGLSLDTESSVGFFNAWNVQMDYIYSNHQNSVDHLDLTLTQNVDAAGSPIFLPDGREQMFAIDATRAGCNAVFIAPGQGFSDVTTECDAGRDDQDILLTNGPSGTTDTFSIQLGKLFDFSDSTSMNFRFGYAYTDAQIGNPVTSSTATSSFEEVATARINNNVLAPAQYANKHNYVLSLDFKHYFFDNNPTSVGLFLRRRSGRPFSYAYDNNTPTGVFGDSDNEERNLFYVPTGASDPLVDMTSLENAGTLGAFMDFLDNSGLSKYAGQISPRNEFNEVWTTDLDVRIQQDIPLPGANHSLKLFLDIENILNMFDDDLNLQRFADNGDVGEAVPILDAALSADGSQYIYSNFNPGGSRPPDFNPIETDPDDSLWRVQLGVKYLFGGSR